MRAKVSGLPLGELLERRILAPLGMVDTAFSIEEADLPRLAQCFRCTGVGEFRPVDFGDGTSAADNGVGSCGLDTPYLRGKPQGHAEPWVSLSFRRASLYLYYGEALTNYNKAHLQVITIPPAARQAPSGGGGLLSTLDDYARFAACLAGGGELDGVRVIRAETLAECHAGLRSG